MSMSTNEQRAEIVAKLAAGTLLPDAALPMLEALSAASNGGSTFAITIGANGGLRVAGKGLPFPFGCTQYAEGWETILDHATEIRKAIADGKDYLSRKDDTDAVKAAKSKHPKRVAAADKAAKSAAKRAA